MRKWLSTLFVLMAVPALAGTNRWTTSGPYGAYVSSFTYHPQQRNLVFASTFDGIFRSRTGGQSWERLDLSGRNLVVRIAAGDPGSILAAGYSVSRSTDQGDSWQEISSAPFRGEGVTDMEFATTSPAVLFAITSRKGVFKSTDSGVTWEAKNSGLKLAGEKVTPCLAVHPDKGNTVYALAASRKVFRTTDGGESWSSVSNGLDFSAPDNWVNHITSLEIDQKTPQTLFVASVSRIYRTVNGGTQWSRLQCPSDVGTYDCGASSIALDPAQPLNVYAARSGLLKSTDGGTSWKHILVHPFLTVTTNGIAVDPHKSGTVLLGGNSAVFRSVNGGASFRTVNGGLDQINVPLLETPEQQPGLILTAGQEVSFRTDNGGAKWSPISYSAGAAVWDIRIHPRNANFLAAAMWPPSLSTDGGKNWYSAGVPHGTNLDSYAIALDPDNQNVIYFAVTEFGPGIPVPISLGIFKTTDQGKSWKLVNSGLTDKNVQVLSVDPSATETLYAGTASGKMFKTVNGGGSWKNISRGLPVLGCCFRSIAVDPGNSSVVYAVAADSVHKSTNGGAQWTLKNNGLNTRVNFVSLDPRNSAILYAGTFGAMFISTDRAESWSAFDSTGLTGAFDINEVVVNPAQPDTFIAGTARGVYQYTLKGSNPAAPVIEQISPSTGKAGETITINGRNFGSTQGTSTVVFAGVSAGTTQSWTDTQIQVKAPNGVSTGPVTVTVGGKKSNRFEFIGLPASGSVHPTSGPPSGGTRVAILAPSGISGAQFNVLFGSTLAGNIRFTAPNIITCDSPRGSGTVTVSVTSSAVVYNMGTFTYQ